MYKILLSMVFLCIGMASFSQTAMTSQYSLASDTVVNTATKTLAGPTIKGVFKTLVVVYTVAKVSGTVAGTGTLQASLDGANWFTASSTSFTNTDVANQSFGWSINDPGALYYRVSVTGTGTMSAIISAKMFTRKS